jgi:hypothetical protein
MNFAQVLLNLEILSQIKENDKISIQILPGEKRMFVDHYNYTISLSRWYNGYNREDSIKYIEELSQNIESSASYIINGNHIDDNEILVTSIKKALIGLDSLKQTYLYDSVISSRIILIIEKLNTIIKNLTLSSSNTIETLNNMTESTLEQPNNY